MHPHRGMVHLNGLTQARERATPHRTPEEVGAALGVNGRTVRRWEETGWVKIRYVDKLERLYGVTFPEAHRDETESRAMDTATHARAIVPAAEPTVPPTLESIKKVAALYNARRIQGAPDRELRQLRDSTVEAIRVLWYRDLDGDEEEQRGLAESTFEFYTQMSAPSAESNTLPQAASGVGRGRRKRRL